MATIVIVGCGRMGGAFARAWRSDHRVLVHDPAAQVPEGCEALPDLAALPADALVLLAVKPQRIAEASATLRPHLGAGSVVVSIAAGVTLATLRTMLGDQVRLVRAMPNTPVAIGQGVTGAFAGDDIDAATRSQVEALFRSTGSFAWLGNEAQIDLVTAISGSGPAYFFRFAEALAEAGVHAGLERDTAYELARATLVGSGGLAIEGASLSTLREEVTSPGGTTFAALQAMNAGGLDTLVEAGVTANMARAAELAAEAAG
jgi:pyrroline-5-carboxylate reductase